MKILFDYRLQGGMADKVSRFCVAFLFVLFTPSGILAQIDSLTYKLDTLTVVTNRISSPIKGNINTPLLWNMEMMHNLPKILGNADPMRYTQLLPGVQTTSEYDSGLHVHGCDNGHNFVSIGGVPVYNASHLLGFFSIFNASHFPTLSFSKSALNAMSSNRLAGTLNMELPNQDLERLNGEFTIGPMSSQGTLRSPISKNGSLFISARASFLNLLYGQWLKIDQSQLSYYFQDFNVTYLHNFGQKDKLWLNVYYGNDNVGLEETNVQSKVALKWQNVLVSAHWLHQIGEGKYLSQSVYMTRYDNFLNMDLADANLELPSYISSMGYQGKWESEYIKAGVEAIWHDVQPQKPQTLGKYRVEYEPEPRQKARELTASIDYSQPLGNWMLNGGLKGTIYALSGSGTYSSLDPIVTVVYKTNRDNTFRFSYGLKHQYLVRTGFSNMGLPTEFWFSSGKYSLPQYSRNLNVGFERPILNGNFRVTLEAYYKKLYNQVEYNGNLLDFMDSRYRLEDVLLIGSGQNYGINLLLNKRTGRLTGWLSYSLGRAFRKFNNPQYPHKYPASHERIHELNVVGIYRFNHRWNVGGTLVCASGTPFTAPKHFYIMNGQLVSEYGQYNANRLKPYVRMDLSVNYTIKKEEESERGFNFSLYNAFSKENDLFYTLKIYKSKYYYNPVRFIVWALPSISYYYKF